jgi:ribose 5-phosphate isomerase B
VKTFEIITEADARTLQRGETVRLTARGHVTPLAQDTLRERRIVVVREGAVSEAEKALQPANEIRSVAIASDERGTALRRRLVTFLRGRGLSVRDLSSDGNEAADYTDVALPVARAVASGEADAGIVVDATGIGAAIVANKIPGIRAAALTSETLARYAREQNGTNVVTLGAAIVADDEAAAILTTWLGTPMRDADNIRLLAKIQALEKRR